MDGTESIQIFWEVMGTSAPSLILTGIDLLFSILAVVFMAIGTIWLLKSAQPGSRYLMLGFVGSIVGALVYAGYLMLWDGAESELMEDALGLFTAACTAMWGYGYLRLCGFLKREHEARVSDPPSDTAR